MAADELSTINGGRSMDSGQIKATDSGADSGILNDRHARLAAGADRAEPHDLGVDRRHTGRDDARERVCHSAPCKLRRELVRSD